MPKPFSAYKEKEKDKEYHKLYLNDILSTCIDQNAQEKELMARCYEYFHGTAANPMAQLMDVFNINPDGRGNSPMVLPLIHMNINKIKPKIQTLLGDLIDLGFEAHVEAINQEAKAAKLEYRNQMIALFTVKDKLSEVDKLIGLNPPDLPETLEKLENFLKHDYKENSELVMEACLKYSLQYNSYLLTRLQLFLDIIISRECHAKTYLQKGFPIIERQNPLNIYYPININDNEFLDKTYKIVNIYYAPIEEVIEKFGITQEELEKDLQEAKGGTIEGAWYGRTVSGSTIFTPYDRNNKNLILVTEAEWLDNKTERVTIAKTSEGIEDVIIRYGEDAESYKINENRWKKKGKELIKDQKRVVSTLRKCTRIGCNMIKDWGEVEGVTYAPLSWSTAERQITSLRPYYMQGQSQSIVMDVMSLQDFVKYIWTKLQLEITKSSGKVIVINLKAIPKQFGSNPTEAISKVMHYLKGYNIVFRDAEQEEFADGRNGLPVDEVDMGLSTAINAFFSLLQLCEAEIDIITGLNSARMGQVANNQLASVTTMALNQSAKQTKHLINGFLQFESRLLTKHAQQIKYSWWMYPKAWSIAIGDVYYAFMEATRDITLDNFMITVKNDVISKATLEKYMIASLQTGSMSAHDALAIEMMSNDSVKEAVRAYLRKMEMQAEESKQMQMQMASQQQEMAQQQALAKQQEIAQQGQNQLADRKLKGEYDLQKQAMRDNANVKEKQMATQQQVNEMIE
jgi:hypothetical protein